MARKIVITSGKGGVGKTTLAANLGIRLALAGERVIVCDTDFGLNNIDVVCGVEGLIQYDLVDAIEGRCRPKQALVRHPQYANLFILASNKSEPDKYVSPQAVRLILDTLAAFRLYPHRLPRGHRGRFSPRGRVRGRSDRRHHAAYIIAPRRR